MVGEEFGTVLVRVEDSKGRDFQCEVTTLRKDGGYTDGRRLDNVTFGNDIAEDLARRDFTINAMSMADATVVLPFNFTRLIWAALLGYMFFSEIPDLWTWLGGTIIFLASIWLTRISSKRQK
ncbi:MAG: hypothetical protein CMM37_06710 [Rhodospirillaceae bacterium]|nr:hypothetical protein [Rhodospirillaceae bacterium]